MHDIPNVQMRYSFQQLQCVMCFPTLWFFLCSNSPISRSLLLLFNKVPQCPSLTTLRHNIHTFCIMKRGVQIDNALTILKSLEDPLFLNNSLTDRPRLFSLAFESQTRWEVEWVVLLSERGNWSHWQLYSDLKPVLKLTYHGQISLVSASRPAIRTESPLTV